jgi:hypothetical protein
VDAPARCVAAVCGSGEVGGGGVSCVGGGAVCPVACLADADAAPDTAAAAAHPGAGADTRDAPAPAAARGVCERGPAGGERVCVCVLRRKYVL